MKKLLLAFVAILSLATSAMAGQLSLPAYKNMHDLQRDSRKFDLLRIDGSPIDEMNPNLAIYDWPLQIATFDGKKVGFEFDKHYREFHLLLDGESVAILPSLWITDVKPDNRVSFNNVSGEITIDFNQNDAIDRLKAFADPGLDREAAGWEKVAKTAAFSLAAEVGYESGPVMENFDFVDEVVVWVPTDPKKHDLYLSLTQEMLFNRIHEMSMRDEADDQLIKIDDVRLMLLNYAVVSHGNNGIWNYTADPEKLLSESNRLFYNRILITPIYEEGDLLTVALRESRTIPEMGCYTTVYYNTIDLKKGRILQLFDVFSEADRVRLKDIYRDAIVNEFVKWIAEDDNLRDYEESEECDWFPYVFTKPDKVAVVLADSLEASVSEFGSCYPGNNELPRYPAFTKDGIIVPFRLDLFTGFGDDDNARILIPYEKFKGLKMNKK